jgi:DnaK suppressor protein
MARVMSTRKGKAGRARFEYFRGKLLAERRRLQRRLSSWLDEAAREAPDKEADELDMASSGLERDTSYQIGTFESDVVRQIDRALSKIEKGTYGECEICGRKIPAERLRMLPFVTLCVPCQSNVERRRKVDADMTLHWENPAELASEAADTIERSDVAAPTE